MYSALESQPRGQYVMISAVGSRLLLLRTVDIYRGSLFSMSLVNVVFILAPIHHKTNCNI